MKVATRHTAIRKEDFTASEGAVYLSIRAHRNIVVIDVSGSTTMTVRMELSLAELADLLLKAAPKNQL